jgi:hypothetical protein
LTSLVAADVADVRVNATASLSLAVSRWSNTQSSDQAARASRERQRSENVTLLEERVDLMEQHFSKERQLG